MISLYYLQNEEIIKISTNKDILYNIVLKQCRRHYILWANMNFHKIGRRS